MTPPLLSAANRVPRRSSPTSDRPGECCGSAFTGRAPQRFRS